MTDYITIAKNQNKQLEELAKQQKEQAKLEAAAKNQDTALKGQLEIESLDDKYRAIYDENAIRQYIGERRVAENMANLGLTDSGLNRTQNTALQVSRGNADHNTRLQYESAVRSIEQSVRDEIAATNNELDNTLASIDQTVAKENADRLYTAEQKQFEYEIQQEKDKKEAEQQSVTDHNTLINRLATAFKSSAQTGITVPHASDILLEYIVTYNLSVTDAQYIMTYAGYAPALLKKDFFEVAIKERDRWNTIKSSIEEYKTSTQAGKDYNLTASFEDALDNYNVEQYGADKLLPTLVREQYLTKSEVDKIKSFYNTYIGKKPAEKIKKYGESKILSYAEQLYKKGSVSEVAYNYMVALFNYHKK